MAHPPLKMGQSTVDTLNFDCCVFDECYCGMLLICDFRGRVLSLSLSAAPPTSSPGLRDTFKTKVVTSGVEPGPVPDTAAYIQVNKNIFLENDYFNQALLKQLWSTMLVLATSNDIDFIIYNSNFSFHS